MRLKALLHAPEQGLGLVEKWAASRGHALEAVHVFEGQRLPELERCDGLFSLGGPMGAEDAGIPWIGAEKGLLLEAMQSDIKVLGIGLGAHLMASALGAKPLKNPQPERGWFPVTLTEEGKGSDLFVDSGEEPLMALHWHGGAYETPQGARCLAETPACPQQAFRYTWSGLALQFHLEMDEPAVEALLKAEPGALSAGGLVQDAATIRGGARRHAGGVNYRFLRLLDRFFAS